MEIVVEVRDCFMEAYSMVCELVEHPTINNNSLEKRYRMSLEEEKTHIPMVLEILDESQPDLERLSTELYIIYHADQVGNMHLGGWKRETNWNQSGTDEVEFFAKQAGEIKQKLVEAIPNLNKILGQESARYVIPALYRG